jgi:hypothetical protein
LWQGAPETTPGHGFHSGGAGGVPEPSVDVREEADHARAMNRPELSQPGLARLVEIDHYQLRSVLL